MIFVVVSLLVMILEVISLSRPPIAPTLVIVDGFTEYISGFCKEYCNAHGIRVIEVLSPYICGIFRSRGQDVPESLQAPINEDDIRRWAFQNEIARDATEVATDADEIDKDGPVYVISESDSGVSTAEKIAAVLGLPGNGLSPQLRNKFESNERAKAAGLSTVQQRLVRDIDEAISFARELWSDCDPTLTRCILKPYRCASLYD